MRILEYLNSFGQNTVANNDLDEHIDTAIENTDKLVFSSVDSLMRAEKLESDHGKHRRYLKIINVELKSKYRANSIGAIQDGLRPNIRANLAQLETIKKKVFEGTSKNISLEGMNVQQTSVVAAIEMFESIINFTPMFNLTLIKDLGTKSSVKGDNKHYVTKYDRNYIDARIQSYAVSLAYAGTKPSEFKKRIMKQSDAVVSEDNEGYIAGDEEAILPFTNKFVGNPFYHGGMVWADYQAGKYKENKERVAATKLYILDLENTKNGESNAAIDKEIRYRTELMEKYEEKVEDYEKSLEETT